MIIDAWNPKTFSAQIIATLTNYSSLVFDYHVEDGRLMDEHLNSSPYQSLKPNKYYSTYQNLLENTLAPILSKSRIRTWHYTRLTDEEVDAMYEQLVSSSLESLRHRLNNLVKKNFLTQDDAEEVFAQSPYHQQNDSRIGCLCTTTIPLPYCDSGVELLLESWGGESAYFWLSDKRIDKILKKIGHPRIVEIETALTDGLNGFMVAETVLQVWARQLGIQTNLSGHDLFITESIKTAKVVRIHTKGDGHFEAVAKMYPEGVDLLLSEQE